VDLGRTSISSIGGFKEGGKGLKPNGHVTERGGPSQKGNGFIKGRRCKSGKREGNKETGEWDRAEDGLAPDLF